MKKFINFWLTLLFLGLVSINEKASESADLPPATTVEAEEIAIETLPINEEPMIEILRRTVPGKKATALNKLAVAEKINQREIEDIFNVLPLKIQNFLIHYLSDADAVKIDVDIQQLIQQAQAKFGPQKGLKLALRLLYRLYAAALRTKNFPKEGDYHIDIDNIITAINKQGLQVLETMHITLQPDKEGRGAKANWRMVKSGRELAQRQLLEAERVPSFKE